MSMASGIVAGLRKESFVLGVGRLLLKELKSKCVYGGRKLYWGQS